MGNYDSTPSSKMIDKEQVSLIDWFFGHPGHVGAGSPCPKCGAKIEWNYINAKNMILHINWHRNLSGVVGNTIV